MLLNTQQRIEELYKKVNVNPNHGSVSTFLNQGTMDNKLSNGSNVSNRTFVNTAFSTKDAYCKF